MCKMKREIGERIDVTLGIEVTGVAKDVGVITKAAPSDELGYGEIDVVVSNSGEDRHGEHIVMEGIDVSQVKRNPTVLWAHDYSGLAIGKIEKLWKESGNLLARIKFAYDISEFAHTVYKMVVGGFINAVSIGGVVRKWKNDDWESGIIEKLEMVELSVVPVGAHPDALVIGKSFKKSLGVSRKDLRSQYSDFVSKGKVLDKMNGLTENERGKYLASLKGLVKILEDATPEQPIEVKEEQGTVKKIFRFKLSE